MECSGTLDYLDAFFLRGLLLVQGEWRLAYLLVVATMIISTPMLLPPIFSVPITISVSVLITVPIVGTLTIVNRRCHVVTRSIIPIVSKRAVGNGKREPQEK